MNARGKARPVARPYEVTVRRGGKALYLGRFYLLRLTTTKYPPRLTIIYYGLPPHRLDYC
eukprot:scaffold23591_cov58-Phaeocystis_antarctica.AAC.6